MTSKQKLAYGINEACTEANIGRDGIYAAIKEGLLVARKFGRRTLILDDDLRAFLQSLPRLELDARQSEGGTA
jgi:excisionase family DNA binding protein